MVSSNPAFTGDVSKGGSSFDADFAEAISKPLPQWFKDAEAEKNNLMQEIEKNRERIIEEFKAKYDVGEDVKRKEQEEKWARIQSIYEKKMKKSQQNWLSNASKLFGSVAEKTKNSEETDDEELEEWEKNQKESKENWEKFLAEEEESTGFYLPGVFDVFPELKLKWPIWARKKDGKAVKCEIDA